MTRITLLFLFVFTLGMFSNINAANIIPNAGATETFAVNNGDKFYDPTDGVIGGIGGDCTGTSNGNVGDYPNCDCTTVTTITGTNLSATFESYKIFGSFDWLKIYDGTNTSAALLFDSNVDGDELADLVRTSINSTTDALTFEFNATSVINTCGWEIAFATASAPPPCDLTCPDDVTLEFDDGECFATASIPNPVPTETDCLGTLVALIDAQTGSFDDGVMPAGWSIDDGTGTPVAGYAGATSDGGGLGNAVLFDCNANPLGVPGGFAARMGTTYMYIFDDGPFACTSNDNDCGVGYVVTETYDLTGLTGVNLAFDWGNGDFAGSGDFLVDVWDGSAWVNILTEMADNTGSFAGSVDAYANADFAIRFGYDDEGSFAWGAAVDNLTLNYVDPSAVTIINDFNNDIAIVDEEFPLGVTTITFTGYDLSGNVVTCETNVTVNDPGPFIDCPDDIEITLDAGECEAFVHYNIDVTACAGLETSSFTIEQWDALNVDAALSLSCSGGLNSYFRVYDLTNISVPDDAMPVMNSVDVYWRTSGAQTVTVNVYELTGPLMLANMNLISTGAVDILSAAYGDVTNVPVDLFDWTSYDEIVVEVVTELPFTMGHDNSGTLEPSYLAAAACGITEPTNPADIGFPNNHALFAPVFEYTAVSDLVVGGIVPGGAFPIGVTTNTIVVTDVNGLSDTCVFDVIVNEYPTPDHQLFCNDLVNASVDENCELYIGADDILEGGPYGCYDNYTVVIEDANGNPVPNPVPSSYIGEMLIVSVYDADGHTCWGKVLVEDKLIPDLECNNYEVSCTANTDPSTAAAVTMTSSNEVFPNDALTAGSPVTYEFPVNISGTIVTVSDVNLSFEAEHTWVGDISIDVTSPSGTTIRLFESLGPGFFGCDGDDMDVVMDDQATLTYADMEAMCNTTSPAIEGTFQPQIPFSTFNGEDANGTWTVTVSDNVGGDDGTILYLALDISASATQGLPFPVGEDAVVTDNNDGTYTVSGFDCDDVLMTYIDNTINLDCTDSSGLISRTIRTWTATDGSGNSTTCQDTIEILRASLATIAPPSNHDGIDLPTLTCDGSWDTDGDGIPSPSELGDDISASCNLWADYTDDIFEAGCKIKIFRNWQLWDGCTGETGTFQQVIIIKDNTVPEITCPSPFEANLDEDGCSATVVAPAPSIYDECSDVSYTVVVDAFGTGTFVPSCAFNGVNYIFCDLPAGTHYMIYTATDACGNAVSCTVEFTVADNVTPVPICDVNTRVSLGSDGLAVVPATTFDDGSYDNCGIDRIKVRRKTKGTCVDYSANDRQWKDAEEFCCDDIGTPVEVELGVWDVNGNFNYCWVVVEVEDKTPPQIVPPADVWVSCDYKFDYTNLDRFGTVQTSQLDVEPIIIDDPEYADCGGNLHLRPYTWGFDGYAFDNCTVTITETSNVDVACGKSKFDQFGNPLPAITRVFTATDADGRTASAKQFIYIVDCNPFTSASISWPSDVALDACSAFDVTPDNTGYPSYDDDKCSIVADTFTDLVLSATDVCFKILRTWTVIDWCQIDANGLPARWDHTQVIKVADNEPPVITPSNPECTPTDDCTGGVDLSPTVEDCTPDADLTYAWFLDADNDGTYDYSGNTQYPSIPNLPYGTHSILWEIEDMCGNRSSLEYEFTVQDCKKPSPVCFNGLSTVVMPSSGAITVWAIDFDASSFDNCDTDLDFRIWYPGMDSSWYPDQSVNWTRPDTNSTGADVLNLLPTGAIFTCDGFSGDNGTGISGTFEIEMYVVDDFGNWDYCTTYVVVEDNDDVCPDGTVPFVDGTVTNELGDVVDNVSMDLYEFGQPSQNKMNGADGSYRFYVNEGTTNTVSGDKDDHYLNGVTAQDLALIQRHVAGIDFLNSNYKKVAADANADKEISILDVLELRKLLLGLTSELPNNKSWVNLDASYDFAGITEYTLPTDVYNQQEITYTNVIAPMMNTNFIGVKVGDVDNDAISNATQEAEERAGTATVFTTNERSFVAGQTVKVPVTAENFVAMSAYQFTLGFDASVVEFAGVEAGALNVTADNFGTQFANRGVVSTVWYNTEDVTLASDEVLFTLSFNAKQAGQLSSTLNIGSVVTEAIAFSNEGSSDVELHFNTEEGTVVNNTFALFQNEPNPVVSSTVIGYVLPEASEVKFTIYDVSGKLLSTIEVDDAVKGYNEVILDKSDFGATGVLYYQVETDGFSATKKMVVVK